MTNNECQKKDEGIHDSLVKELVVRGQFDDRRFVKLGKSRSISRGKFPAEDECAFCCQKCHWKKDYPKLTGKDKRQVEGS